MLKTQKCNMHTHYKSKIKIQCAIVHIFTVKRKSNILRSVGQPFYDVIEFRWESKSSKSYGSSTDLNLRSDVVCWILSAQKGSLYTWNISLII